MARPGSIPTTRVLIVDTNRQGQLAAEALKRVKIFSLATQVHHMPNEHSELVGTAGWIGDP